MDVRSDAQRTRDDLSQRLEEAEAASRSFEADLEEARREIEALRKNADAVSKAHGEELAKAEAHRRQKLREAVKRAARVQALEGFLQAAKEAAGMIVKARSKLSRLFSGIPKGVRPSEMVGAHETR